MPADSPSPAMKWTDRQHQAIRTLDSNLLVSAAAGSGKTSVLAERCAYLVADEPRCNVTQLLVVTFTEAAASEMKGRIETALRKRYAEHPDDQHLQRQLALMERADICTLHSFCHRLLREYFHRVGLDPDFRVLDADEASLLRLETARELFLDCYNRADAEAFQQFIDAFGDGRDDDLVRHVIEIDDLLRSLIDPERWLRQAIQRIEEAAGLPLEQSALGREYLCTVRRDLDDLLRECREARAAVARMTGFDKYVSHLDELRATAEQWRDLLQKRGYDELARAVARFELPKLPTIRSTVDGKEVARGLVDPVCHLFRNGPLPASLEFTSEEWRKGLQSTLPHARVLLDLLREFAQRYEQRKSQERAVDFADLETLTLALLSDPVGCASAHRSSDIPPTDIPAPPTDLFSEDIGVLKHTLHPSAVARVLQKRYRFVLVDEYQDINEVQDTILALASHESAAAARTPNLFCVGDVKQSIYGFRLAEPARFLDRASHFRESPAAGKVVDLQENFRSRKRLLDAINAVFERLMTRTATDIQYDQTQKLYAGAAYPPDLPSSFRGAPIELHLLPMASGDDDEPDDDRQEPERDQREGMFVAHRIRQLMGQGDSPRMNVVQRLKDGSTLTRPIEYRDIVILLRATRYRSEAYAEMLLKSGIPVYNAAGAGYFESTEIRDMLAILRILDNLRQDIPLAAVLRSPLASLPRPEEAMARIRLAYPSAEGQPPTAFHEAALRYAKEKDDPLAADLRGLFANIDRWRAIARQRPVAELIWTIYQESGYLAYCGGLDDGPRRTANLLSLHARARQFGTFAHQGLYRFIRFLEDLRQEADAAPAPQLSEAENVVRIMSVHKSKGLEFPVVIVPSLGKRINLRDCGQRILADRRACLGMQATDLRKCIRYPSLAWTLLSQRLRRAALAEEMRVLYVAMTRAREHLILIGTCRLGATETWARRWAGHQGALPDTAILGASALLDWIGPVAAAAGDGAIRICEQSPESLAEWCSATQGRTRPPALASIAKLLPICEEPPTNALADRILAEMSREYPRRPFTTLQAARSVTSYAKGTVQPPSGDRPAPSTGPAALSAVLPLPRFMTQQAELTAADRGTAVHLFLEHIDFARPCTNDDLRQQLADLVQRRILSEPQAAAADIDTIRWFLDSDLGRQIRARPANLIRELPLIFAMPPGEFIDSASSDPLDQVVMRGRLDALLADDRGFILIDYKTDRVWGPAISLRAESYRPQLDLYGRAIQAITGKPVHTRCLIFLSPRKIVPL